MGHTTEVSKAIQAALEDIYLLRLLVNAADETAANAILNAYDKSLTLDGSNLHDFWISLTQGRVTISVRDLVDYYDRLEPKPRIERVTRPQPEWNP